MTISLRLDDRLARELEKLAALERISKSELIRRCLEAHLARRQRSLSPWELGKDLFGRAASGKPDLSRNRKQVVKDRIRARQGRD